MNLRLKLFLLIGSLFIIIAILSYYLPQLLLMQDFEKIHSTFNILIAKHQQDDHEERKATLLNRVQEQEFLLNSDLYSINDSLTLRNALNPQINQNNLNLWKEAVKFCTYNPEVGFMQINNGSAGTIVLAIENGKIYSVEATPLTHDMVSIKFLRTMDSEEPILESTYIGIKLELPHTGTHISVSDQLILGDLAGIVTPTYYYLYHWDKFFELSTPVTSIPQPTQPISKNHKQIEQRNSIASAHDIGMQLQSAFRMPSRESLISREAVLSIVSGAQSLSVNPLVAYSVSTIKKRFRLREEATLLKRDLTNVFMQNLQADSPLAPHAPLGIAKLTPQAMAQKQPMTGYALLGSDLFFDHSLFNDVSYYLKYSDQGTLPIALNLAFIDSPSLYNVYIGNTMAFLNASKAKNSKALPALLTLGSSLQPLLEDLAISSELVLFLTDANNIRLALSANGTSIAPSNFKDFPIEDMISKSLSDVTVNGVKYDYFKMQPVPGDNTFVLFIIPQSEEILYQFKNTMSSEMVGVSHTISYQLFAVSLLCLGISLIVLGMISSRITKPIALLAKATEDVSKGHYSDIDLPLSNSKNDEIAVLSNSFSKMVTGLRDREKIRAVLNKVVSKEIAEEILKGNIHLGGEEKVITILFSDIRHFSKMTEHLPPQVVIKLLNTYMTKMSDIIEREGGVIDKYVGDEIMALYGAPLPSPDNALRAITTALSMMEALNDWNNERAEANLPPVEIGVGIHTGIVVAGNMGAETRLNYTVLGANVNLASRLCTTAAPMQILITEHTLNAYFVKEAIIVEELPPMQFRGFSEPVRTFSVKGFNPNYVHQFRLKQF